MALIPGKAPLELRRVNYFDSDWFEGFFDPHPDHPAPPTLVKLAERTRKTKSISEPGKKRQKGEDETRLEKIVYAVLAVPLCYGLVLLMDDLTGDWFSIKEALAGVALISLSMIIASFFFRFMEDRKALRK